MFCTNCGREIPDGVRFCTECGSPVVTRPAGAQAGETARMPSPDPGRPVASAAPPAERPLPAGRHDRRPRRQAPVWAVVLAATCAILACAGTVAAFVLLGGFSPVGGEPEGQAQVVEGEPGEAEPSTGEVVAAVDEPGSEAAAEPEDEPEAVPALEAAPAPEAEPVASEISPYWGVWVGAFSHLENAQDRMADASANGLPSPRIEMSSDWSNLNQAGYYVVSVGRCGSQAEAEALLAEAQAYYADAYVKYTGDYQG